MLQQWVHPPSHAFIHFLLLIQSVEVLEPITGFKVQQRSGVHCLLHSRDGSGACRALLSDGGSVESMWSNLWATCSCVVLFLVPQPTEEKRELLIQRAEVKPSFKNSEVSTAAIVCGSLNVFVGLWSVFSWFFSIHEPHWCSLLLTSPLVNQSASGRCDIQSGTWRNALEVDGIDESSLSEDGHTCRTKDSAYPIIGQKVEYILDGLPSYCSHLNRKCLNWTTEIIRMYKNLYESQVIKTKASHHPEDDHDLKDMKGGLCRHI